MNGKEKRPPIKLEEVRKPEEKKPGELGYQGSTSGKFRDWSQVLLPVAIAVVISGLVLFQFAAGKGDVAALSANDQELMTRIEGVDESITGLLGSVDTALTEARSAKNSIPDMSGFVTRDELPGYAKSGDVAALETRLAALEVEEEEEEEQAALGSTRWRFKNAGFVDYNSAVFLNMTSIDVGFRSNRIEESDSYEVELEIENRDLVNGTVVGTAAIEVVLDPSDYVVVDEGLTYMDTDESPWWEWDTDFIVREREDRDVCRRIAFTSERYNFGTFAPGEKQGIDLILELYYID